MIHYLTLGPTPYSEECQQVGTPEFDGAKAKTELKTFADQLRRLFPKCRFGIKTFPHDFGSYSEVVVYFDNNNEQSIKDAFEAEGAIPEHWDEESMKVLGLERHVL